MILALLACDREPAPIEPVPVPAPAPPAPTVWSVDTIAELVPVASGRSVAVARAIPPLAAYDAAMLTLGRVVEQHAGDPDNPWAIAHGLLARGAGFRLADGREAIPHLFASYAEARPGGLVGFPRSRGPVRVEPHTDLLLKNMAEAGAAPDASFPTAAGTSTMADLYRWTLLKTYLVPATNHSSYDGPNDVFWGLQALAQWAPSSELQWIAVDGTPMDFDDLTDFGVAVLVKETAFLVKAMAADTGFEKKGQGIFKYTCGGAHVLQGAAFAVARGFGSDTGRAVIEQQVRVAFYRLPVELRIYDEAMKRNPKFKRQLLEQRMKFLGHFLETMSKLQALGFYTPDEAQLHGIEGAAQNLALTVEALGRDGLFDALPALRASDEQLYLDVIGDAAHALRGWELALGQAKVLL